MKIPYTKEHFNSWLVTATSIAKSTLEAAESTEAEAKEYVGEEVLTDYEDYQRAKGIVEATERLLADEKALAEIIVGPITGDLVPIYAEYKTFILDELEKYKQDLKIFESDMARLPDARQNLQDWLTAVDVTAAATDKYEHYKRAVFIHALAKEDEQNDNGETR